VAFLLHQTNQHECLRSTCYADNALVFSAGTSARGLARDQPEKAVYARGSAGRSGSGIDGGPRLSQTARTMLTAILEARARARPFYFHSANGPRCSLGGRTRIVLFPEPSIVPLLPRHVHTLTAAGGPVLLNGSTYDVFLSSNEMWLPSCSSASVR